MSCSVAIPGSPVFSTSRLPLFCKSAASASPDSPAAPPSSAFADSPLHSFVLRAQHREDLSPSPQVAAGASVRKRRRPAPLLVPVTTAAEAVWSVGSSEVEQQGEGYAAYCRRGKGRCRVEMEDRHVAKVRLGGDHRVAFFGVFDGHGGKRAAEFAAEHMPNIMAEEIRVAAVHGEDHTVAVKEAMRRGYRRTDEEFSKEQRSGGACCVTALLREGRLVVSNAGDCRAVLSRAGKAEALTSDHRASREDEKERIESHGGFVMNCRGTWRVQGSLAVSRGIGDTHLKQWVVAEPDTATLPVDADCEFLILASDGLWDKVGNQEAVDVARPLSTDGGMSSRLSSCRRLVELSLSRGSTDDISVVIIQLQHFLGY